MAGQEVFIMFVVERFRLFQVEAQGDAQIHEEGMVSKPHDEDIRISGRPSVSRRSSYKSKHYELWSLHRLFRLSTFSSLLS